MAGVWHGNGSINRRVQIRPPAALLKVGDFCKALGGKTPIHSILISNNGMAAVKFMCSIRTWAYETFGPEKAILLVAMATPKDMRINAEHIRIADQFVKVPGVTNNNNYANVQLIVESHHLEVKLLCNECGNVAALHNRDCSIQRRHQKIIEESPITVAPPETVKQLEQGAWRLAKFVNYVGAATVEYLYSMDIGEYYFLELNPRLQKIYVENIGENSRSYGDFKV